MERITPRYKDKNVSIDERVADLLSRMTIEEKVGQMFHSIVFLGKDGKLAPANPMFTIPGAEELISERHLTHLNLIGPVDDAFKLAEWHNLLQSHAASTRLGIPITLSTDPRSHFAENLGTGSRAGSFSQWPETLGFAALRSPELVEQFANIARQEYLASGMRLVLGPQVDLATEYRWSRISGTFGEESKLSSELGAAYIRGFRGQSELGPPSVSCVGKHFPGGGPQKDGEDPHFTYGREQVYPGGNFDYHLEPFEELIRNGVSQMMPYYGMPVGLDYEEVGFSYNKEIISGLLQKKLNFGGIVLSDWQVITNKTFMGDKMVGRAWGVEHLDGLARVEKLLDAGVDQIGGESCTELLLQLVHDGRVSEARLDHSVKKILREKFALGLFDNAFVDPETAARVIGKSEFRRAGEDVQRRSYTLLSNQHGILPLSSSKVKAYVEGIDKDSLASYGVEVVGSPAEADLTLLRLKAPYEVRPGNFEQHFHAGSLEYPDAELQRLLQVLQESKASVVDVYLDRPVVLTEIAAAATALCVNYGASDAAFLDVITVNAAPEGKLPFDLPRSMSAVVASRTDVPFDTENPLFRFGHGLRYR
ncbi:glycosyl hydrolase family 3 N terminal domain-containing protein, partial [Aureobasidium melanogenum]